MQRIGRLLQASMFLNYMWQKMRVAGAPSRWGSNCVWCNAINTVPWQLESGNYFIFNCDVNGRNIESLKQMIRNIRKECAQVIFPVCLFRQVRQVLDFPRFPHASLSFSPGLNITEDSQKHTQCCLLCFKMSFFILTDWSWVKRDSKICNRSSRGCQHNTKTVVVFWWCLLPHSILISAQDKPGVLPHFSFLNEALTDNDLQGWHLELKFTYLQTRCSY